MWWRDSDGRINGGILGTVPGPSILHQRAPASVSKRGLDAFCALLLFTSSFRRKQLGVPSPSPTPSPAASPSQSAGGTWDVCVGNEWQQQNRAFSFKCAGLCIKAWLWEEKCISTCPPGDQQAGRVHYYFPPAQMSPCVFYTRCLSCWVLSLSVQFYKIPQLWHYFQIPIKFGSTTLAHDRAHPGSLRKSRVHRQDQTCSATRALISFHIDWSFKGVFFFFLNHLA